MISPARPQGVIVAQSAIDAASQAIRVAADAVADLAARPIDGLVQAVNVVLDAPGRVVVSGLGKSGLVGAKIAATLSSTGTPASFVHAADALHGDSGRLRNGDVMIAISKSGTTAELCAFASMAGERGVPVIAITACNGSSPLAGRATVVLDAGVDRECDPHDLVPSASTTVTLVIGDALAVGLMAARGFGPQDFARHHPGGALGARLT